MSDIKKITFKQRIIYGLVSGLIFATVKSILDREFILHEFIIGTIVFGIIMALIIRFKEKK